MATIRIGHSRLLLCLSLAFTLSGASSEAETEEVPCNRLEAAYFSRNTQNFIYGDNMWAKYNVWGNKVRDPVQLLSDKTITAAAGVSHLSMYLLVSGTSDQAFTVWSGEETNYSPTTDSNVAKVLQTDSIDAIARRQNNLFYFSGCKYAAVDASSYDISDAGDLSDLGLPCNIDAAWYVRAYGVSAVVKGGDVYIWPIRSETANSRQPLLEYFPFLADLNLCQ